MDLNTSDGQVLSRPTWARGLKLESAAGKKKSWSRPTWARGLKHHLRIGVIGESGRAPRGRVD